MSTELDYVHENIGTISALLRSVSELTSQENLPNILDKLFNSEADFCDYQTADGYCSYSAGIKECIWVNCPLGDLIAPKLVGLNKSM